MPMCFQFRSRETGGNVPLQVIDELICQATNSPCDEKHYSNWYDLIVWTGGAYLAKTRDSEITDEAALSEYLDQRENKFLEEEKDILLRFLVREFMFSAWYGR